MFAKHGRKSHLGHGLDRRSLGICELAQALPVRPPHLHRERNGYPSRSKFPCDRVLHVSCAYPIVAGKLTYYADPEFYGAFDPT